MLDGGNRYGKLRYGDFFAKGKHQACRVIEIELLEAVQVNLDDEEIDDLRSLTRPNSNGKNSLVFGSSACTKAKVSVRRKVPYEEIIWGRDAVLRDDEHVHNTVNHLRRFMNRNICVHFQDIERLRLYVKAKMKR